MNELLQTIQLPDIVAIKAKTDNLPSDPAATSDLIPIKNNTGLIPALL